MLDRDGYCTICEGRCKMNDLKLSAPGNVWTTKLDPTLYPGYKPPKGPDMTECSFSHEPEKREAAPNAPGSLPMIADSIDTPVGMVNRPAHYNRGNIEVLDFIRDQKLAFELGSVVKYVCRAGFKDPTKDVEDLEKAQFYLNFMVECARAARDGRKTPLAKDLNANKVEVAFPPAEGISMIGDWKRSLDAEELIGQNVARPGVAFFPRTKENLEKYVGQYSVITVVKTTENRK